MNEHFKQVVLNATGAKALGHQEMIQRLWSGYGSIVRYELIGSDRMDSVVVKHVRMPMGAGHPRGWNTDLSHQRKVHSYQVETQWYKRWSNRCPDECHVPECYALETLGDEVLMVLEDLDAAGFARRCGSVTQVEQESCLHWLANFHAAFLGKAPEGLWKTGTYWHLETRPEELTILDDMRLKSAAEPIDRMLATAKHQTLVHGDAKLANFCFNADGSRVSAVDFQYVGGGCGMKDVAYFVSSCFREEECERLEESILDFYFRELREAMARFEVAADPNELEEEWRSLYPVAWTDFYRFLQGWSPGHWKIHSYSERLAKEVIEQIG